MAVNSNASFSRRSPNALEVIATLFNVKRTCAELVLRRADEPENMIRRFLTERDLTTHEKRSKREGGRSFTDFLGRAASILGRCRTYATLPRRDNGLN
jgi:hypothetical protein